MNQSQTELVFLLDNSGSMSPLTEDTINGYNSFLKTQRAQTGECVLTTILFNSTVKTLHDRQPVKRVRDLSPKDYQTGGCTALLDAIGFSIQKVEKAQRTKRANDCPTRVMMVIMTDGLENASIEFNYKTIINMIEKKKKEGWEFLFLGANMDAVEAAAELEIDEDHASEYLADSAGTELVYEAMNATVLQYRHHGIFDRANIQAIRDDTKKRKARKNR